jgi:hypothetical protein
MEEVVVGADDSGRNATRFPATGIGQDGCLTCLNFSDKI